MALNKLLTCKFCNTEYSLKETERVYGDMIWITYYCKPQCYTKAGTFTQQNMAKPTKSVLVKVHTVLKGCLIEDTEVFELPIDKLEEVRRILQAITIISVSDIPGKTVGQGMFQ